MSIKMIEYAVIKNGIRVIWSRRMIWLFLHQLLHVIFNEHLTFLWILLLLGWVRLWVAQIWDKWRYLKLLLTAFDSVVIFPKKSPFMGSDLQDIFSMVKSTRDNRDFNTAIWKLIEHFRSQKKMFPLRDICSGK